MSVDLLIARAQAAGIQRVYKPNAVPANPTTPYAVLFLDTGSPIGDRLGGKDDSLYRMSLQIFGQSDAAVRDLATKADAAFRSVTLTDLPGAPFSRREVAAPMTRDPDAGGLLGLIHTYRY